MDSTVGVLRSHCLCGDNGCYINEDIVVGSIEISNQELRQENVDVSNGRWRFEQRGAPVMLRKERRGAPHLFRRLDFAILTQLGTEAAKSNSNPRRNNE
ncbi:hypothetical protein HAX54_026802, partial [Datura stramonium]|nr:hypothetical protein [Datura stramonium]